MKKILVVDDDVDLLVNMKTFLRRQGYTVTVTTSCNEGLQILRDLKPDLIFLDLDVGQEDGREMCRKIREQAGYQHIPVIFISANHDALLLYRDYGANGFLKKPFQLSSLSGNISSLLQ